jgi:hypothetical protein
MSRGGAEKQEFKQRSGVNSSLKEVEDCEDVAGANSPWKFPSAILLLVTSYLLQESQSTFSVMQPSYGRGIPPNDRDSTASGPMRIDLSALEKNSHARR